MWQNTGSSERCAQLDACAAVLYFHKGVWRLQQGIPRADVHLVCNCKVLRDSATQVSGNLHLKDVNTLSRRGVPHLRWCFGGEVYGRCHGCNLPSGRQGVRALIKLLSEASYSAVVSHATQLSRPAVRDRALFDLYTSEGKRADCESFAAVVRQTELL
jgi:hypothetical protein